MSQIVVLAGGLATRMRPITEEIPKALIEVKGRPFIDHQLELFKQNGITDVLFCIGYRGQQIINRCGDGSRFGLNVEYSDEGDKLMGTAGALKKAEQLLQDNFMVIYGDSYLTTDFQRVANFFNEHDKTGLMTVFKNTLEYHPSNAAVIDDLIVKYDKETPTPDMKYVDYGLNMFRKSILDYIPADEVMQLEQLHQELIQEKQLLAFEVQERFYEIGSAKGLKDLEDYLSAKDEQ